MRDDLIERISADLSGASVPQLQAGLAVLVGNLDEYLKANPKQASPVAAEKTAGDTFDLQAVFRESVHDVEKEDGSVPEEARYRGLRDGSKAVRGFAAAMSADGDATRDRNVGPLALDALRTTQIAQDPVARAVGERLSDAFLRRLRYRICEDPNGLNALAEVLAKGSMGRTADVVKAILLVGGVALPTLWIPLAVYLALLIMRVGLDVYCDTGSHPASVAG